jgi:DNA-directed RNA polymerase I and III subunit RPAC2
MSLLNIQNATADLTACTFAIRNEDHTLGNILRHTLIQNEENVEFAGYSVPHPSEPIVQIRVQTRTDTHRTPPTTGTSTKPFTAPQALQEACEMVSKQCDFVLDKLEQLLPYVKEDRIQMEQYYAEQNEEDVDDDEAVDDVVDDDEEVVEDMIMGD